MAIAVLIDCRGVTLEQYDEAIERGGFLPGEPLPPEGLFHWVTKTDDGFGVIDVWETREAFEEFLADKIGMVAPEVGWTSTPEIQFFEVHSYFAGSRRRG